MELAVKCNDANASDAPFFNNLSFEAEILSTLSIYMEPPVNLSRLGISNAYATVKKFRHSCYNSLLFLE